MALLGFLTYAILDRRILNTNLGKTARFYAVGKFYVPGSSGDYSGLAIGGTAWSNIVGVQYVSATDYKHYYTFPKGTYLVNINLFANLEASTSNVLGVALHIEVDDKMIANPSALSTMNSTSRSCVSVYGISF